MLAIFGLTLAVVGIVSSIYVIRDTIYIDMIKAVSEMDWLP